MRSAHPFIAAIASLWLCACTSPDDTASAAAPATISGTVYYEGAAAAPGRFLAIAVYASFPPSGPPLASQLIERYEMPFRYEFTGLRPGRYYVGALIDVDRMDTRHAGMLNPTRDPYGYAGGGAPVEIDVDHGAASADITLEESGQ